MSLKFREKLNPTPGDWKLEGEKKIKRPRVLLEGPGCLIFRNRLHSFWDVNEWEGWGSGRILERRNEKRGKRMERR